MEYCLTLRASSQCGSQMHHVCHIHLVIIPNGYDKRDAFGFHIVNFLLMSYIVTFILGEKQIEIRSN